MDKPLIMQWLTINGKQTPVFLPQHLVGVDWVVTGEGNPLPVTIMNQPTGVQDVRAAELIAAVERGGLVAFDQNLVSGVGPIRIWTGTLNEYDAIANKDENIIYMVRS